MKKRQIITLPTFLLFFFSATAQLLHAQSTWIGYTQDLATAGNWNNGVVPSNNTAIFQDSGVMTYNPTLASYYFQLNIINITATSHTYTFDINSGGTIAINDYPYYGVENSGNYPQIFNLNSGGNLILNGGYGSSLDLSNTGMVTYNVYSSSYLFLYNGATAANATISVPGGQFIIDNASYGESATVNLSAGGTFQIESNNTVGALSSTSSGDRILLGGQLTVGSNNTSTQVAGEFFDAGAAGMILKTGTGSLTLLNESNSYSGGTTLSSGTLGLGGNSVLGGGNLTITTGTLQAAATISDYAVPTTVNGAFTLDSNGYSFTVDSSQFTGSEALTIVGQSSGGVILNGTNSFSSLILSSGTLSISSLNALGGGSAALEFDGGTLETTSGITYIHPIAMTGNGIVNVNAGQTTTFSNTLSGSGGLTVESLNSPFSGILVLSGSGNDYSGGTTITSGTLSIAATNNIGTGSVTLAGGTLAPTAPMNFTSTPFFVTTSSAITSTGDTIIGTDSLIGSDGATLTLGGAGSNFIENVSVGLGDTFTIAGPLGGTDTNPLTKTGAGTLALTGMNTYSGGTEISDGTLSIASTDNIGSGSLTLAGGTLNLTSTMNFTSTPFFVTASSTITSAGSTIIDSLTGDDGAILAIGGAGYNFIENVSVGSDATFTIAGVLGVAADTNAFTKLGAGTLVLIGPNTYSGKTVVHEGVLSISAASNLGNTSGITFDSGSTGVLTTTTGIDSGLPEVTLTGPGIINVYPSQTTTISSLISGAGSLTVGDLNEMGDNTGTLILSQPTNTYSGGTILAAGNLQFNSTGAFPPSSPLTINGGTCLLNRNTITTSPFSGTGGFLNLNNGAIILHGTGESFSGQIIGTGAVTVDVSGTQVFSGSNTYYGLTTVTGGTLQMGSSSSFPGNSTRDPSVQSNSLTLTSPGIFDMNGYNTYVYSLSGNGIVNTGGSSSTFLSIAGPGTFSGTIGGSGGVVITNVQSGTSGTVIFSNANTYTGNTTLLAGNFAVTANNAMGTTGTLVFSNLLLNSITYTPTFEPMTNTPLSFSNPVRLSQTGTILVDDGITTTLSGGISGPGGLVAMIAPSATLGSGIVILGGAGSYSGSTTVDGVYLQMGANQAIANTDLILTNSGEFDTGTFDASIQDITASSGCRIVMGGGTLTINPTSSIPSPSSVFGGAMSGTGTLISNGPGTLLITGSVGLSTVTVAAGTLQVGSSPSVGTLSGTTITVDSGATLKGVGTSAGSLTVYGTFSPGASIGTYTHNGTFTLTPGSIFEEQISPTSASELIVTGNVTLAGELHLEPEGVGYLPGTEYTVIHANGGSISGAFNTISSTSPFLLITPIYGSTDFIIALTSTPITQIATTGNAGKVAVALDTLSQTNPASIAGILASLFGLTTNQQVIDALNQMQPALYKGATLAQQSNGVQVRSTITERFQTVLDDENCYVYQYMEGNCQTENKFFHIWTAGIGDFLLQGNNTYYDSPQVGYRDYTGGFVGGMDFQFLKNIYAGVLGAYTHSDIHWHKIQGNATINSNYAGLYLSALGKLFYGNFSVLGAWSSYNEQRNIVFSTVSETAVNNHWGKQLLAHVDTGLNFSVSKFTIRPFDSLDWILQKEGAFLERDAGEYNLDVSSSISDMLRNELGLNFAICRCYHSFKATFDTKISWIREVRLKGKDFNCEFAGTTVPFAVIGYFPSRSLGSFGATLAIDAFGDLFTTNIYYNGIWGADYSDNSIGAQFNIGF